MKTNLKIRGNILVNYTLIIFLMVFIISLLTGIFISRLQKDHVLIAHIEFYPELVKVITGKYLKTYKIFYEDDPSPGLKKISEAIVSELVLLNGISDAALLNREGAIIALHNSQMYIPDIKNNVQLIKALSGIIGYEYSSDHIQNTLDIYIPLIKGNSVYGVVYLKESGGHLNSVIHESRRTVWLFISGGGILLYILLFYIFYHSHRKQVDINKQLIQTQDVTIFALGYQAELRDLETGKHIERTSAYVKILANGLLKNEKYKSYMTGDYIYDLVRSAPLHDIGKVAIPDSILLKPGKLTDDEFKLMQTHAMHGSDILEKAERKLSFPSFFKIAIQMCRHHHEKWDGTGYPLKLTGDNIPLSARIMALADVYDALRSARPYKEEFSHEKCIAIMKAEKGISFDPDIVDVFLRDEKEFETISIRMKDDFPDQADKHIQVHPVDKPV